MAFSAVSFIGLFLIALGTGGIKPCVAPFGAEQFQLPEQEEKMKQYFSWFYASINLGATASTLLTPNLRNKECLDADSCFPLAFGVPAALMVVALSKFIKKIDDYFSNFEQTLQIPFQFPLFLEK